jgi:predicted nucleic acid-binding Zn ribbon protein
VTAAEEYRKALLEETLRSLIRDPSRWAWDTAERHTGIEGRTRPVERDDNRCPGWMCGAVLESPLPPGRYCSPECKQRTRAAQDAFRRELAQLRTGHHCLWCGAPLRMWRRDKKYCGPTCANRHASRERSTHRLVDNSSRRCVWCGGAIPPTRRSDSVTCSRDCNIRLQNQRITARRKAARQAAVMA